MDELNEASPTGPYRAPAVSRACSILRLLGRAGPLGASEIARALQASKGSVHGVLQALLAEGGVEDAPGKKYRIGPLIAELARAQDGSRTLVEVCRKWMARVTEATGHTALLGIPSGARLRIASVVEGTTEVRIAAAPGMAVPALAGAVGKVLLAWGSASLPARLPRFTPYTLTDRAALEVEVERARVDGVALDRGEYLQGVAAAAAPVFQKPGAPAAVLYAIGLLDALPDAALERLARAVKEAAEAATAELSGT